MWFRCPPGFSQWAELENGCKKIDDFNVFQMSSLIHIITPRKWMDHHDTYSGEGYANCSSNRKAAVSAPQLLYSPKKKKRRVGKGEVRPLRLMWSIFLLFIILCSHSNPSYLVWLFTRDRCTRTLYTVSTCLEHNTFSLDGYLSSVLTILLVQVSSGCWRQGQTGQRRTFCQWLDISK